MFSDFSFAPKLSPRFLLQKYDGPIRTLSDDAEQTKRSYWRVFMRVNIKGGETEILHQNTVLCLINLYLFYFSFNQIINMSAIMKCALRNNIKKVAAKRCLFGLPDHAAIKVALDEQMDTLNKDNTAEWNFDFSNDKPLSGKFEWTPLTPVKKTPVKKIQQRRRLIPRLSNITNKNVTKKVPETPVKKNSGAQTPELSPAVCFLSETFGNIAKNSSLGLKRKRTSNDITGKSIYYFCLSCITSL